jgi:hypothetical protein
VINLEIGNNTTCSHMEDLSLIFDAGFDSVQSQQGVDVYFQGITLDRGRNEHCIA